MQIAGCLITRKFNGAPTFTKEDLAGIVALKTPDQSKCQKAYESLNAGNTATVEFTFPMVKEGIYTCVISSSDVGIDSESVTVDMLKGRFEFVHSLIP